MSSSRYDVAIIGAGTIGMLSALSLARLGLSVVLIDKQPLAQAQRDSLARVTALNQASIALLQELGVWDCVPEIARSVVHAMHVWQAGSRDNLCHFDTCAHPHPRLAVVDNKYIQRALLDCLRQASRIEVKICALADLRIDENQATLLTECGALLRSQLLVAADGSASWTAKKLGVGQFSMPYGQQAIMTQLRAEPGHQAIARQIFLPTGPLALLPLHDPLTYAMVWSCDTVWAERYLAQSDDAFQRSLTTASDGALQHIVSMGPRHAHPLQLRLARQQCGMRYVLLGDAARTVHPLAGQGLNLGIDDVVELTRVICMAQQRKQPIGHLLILRRFERARKAKQFAMMTAIEACHRFFSHPSSLVHALSARTLALSNRLSPLKQLCVSFAAGHYVSPFSDEGTAYRQPSGAEL